jgi:hypothetical protein
LAFGYKKEVALHGGVGDGKKTRWGWQKMAAKNAVDDDDGSMGNMTQLQGNSCMMLVYGHQANNKKPCDLDALFQSHKKPFSLRSIIFYNRPQIKTLAADLQG